MQAKVIKEIKLEVNDFVYSPGETIKVHESDGFDYYTTPIVKDGDIKSIDWIPKDSVEIC